MNKNMKKIIDTIETISIGSKLLTVILAAIVFVAICAHSETQYNIAKTALVTALLYISSTLAIVITKTLNEE